MKYIGIKNIESEFIKSKHCSKKQFHFFTCILLFLLTCSCLNISMIEVLGISKFITNVAARWTPKIEDLGKIKFVNLLIDNNGFKDGIFRVSSPFKNYFVKNETDTILNVYGLGDVVVISPIEGRIKSVKYNNGYCDILIENSKIIVHLSEVDFACSNEGDYVLVGDKIAVSLNSIIKFSISCNGEYLSLPAGKNGDTFFE